MRHMLSSIQKALQPCLIFLTLLFVALFVIQKSTNRILDQIVHAALMIFGEVTGYDPRSLGEEERAAFELGVSKEQAQALQEVAYQELQHETPHRNLKTFEPSPLPKQ